MAFCCECGKNSTAKRTINPINKLCNNCIEKSDSSSSFPSQVNNSQMNSCCDNFAQSLHNAITNDVNSQVISSVSYDDLMDKSITELSAAGIIKINTISNGPLRAQLDIIQKEFSTKIKKLDNRVDILKAEKEKMEEQNNMLKGVVVSMQKCLNQLDSNERNKNVIITGLPEGDIIVNQNLTLENDIAKIHYLPKVTVNEHFSYDDIKEFKIVRLGAEKNGYNRVVKIVFSTSKKRDEFLKNSDKLKNTNEP